MGKDVYQVLYEFRFDEGENKLFKILIDSRMINIIRTQKSDPPDWTRLEHKQCTCCTIDRDMYPFCPIAVSLADFIEQFKELPSFNNCMVRCTIPERTYVKKSSVQEGLFSLFGMIMAISGCPVMKFLKPMARFHLPFSTIQETVFRSTSIYLLRQYFEYKKGNKPDFDLKQLDKHYEAVQCVNKGILHRTNSIKRKDADKNAIIILNALAQMLSVEIEDKLHSLEYLFIDEG